MERFEHKTNNLTISMSDKFWMNKEKNVTSMSVMIEKRKNVISMSVMIEKSEARQKWCVII